MKLLPLFFVTLMAAVDAAPKQGQYAVQYNKKAQIMLLHKLKNLDLKSLLEETKKELVKTADTETGLTETEDLAEHLDLNTVVRIVKNLESNNLNLTSGLEEVQLIISTLLEELSAGDMDTVTTAPPTTTSCAADEFQCTNGYCIPARYVCDGDADCYDKFVTEDGDMSDEQGCDDQTTASPTATACAAGYFQCTNVIGGCVLTSYVCDGEANCEDMSDEQGCDDRLGQDCGSRPLLSNNGAYEIGGSPLIKRIVGGVESTAFSWPSICSLTDLDWYSGIHKCGGTLVKNSNGEFAFITAAHCINSTNPSRYRAKCGMHDLRGDSPSHMQYLRFSSLKVHEQYNKDTKDNDIAVFKFLTQPTENNYVKAACIADSDNDGEDSIVVGWGATSFDGPSPYKLRQVTKPIKSDNVCEVRLGHIYHRDNMMCAGYTTGGLDSCQGDSGGPMYTLRNNLWTLTGVVSFGKGCGEAYSPGVYADVYKLRSWIDQNIA